MKVMTIAFASALFILSCRTSKLESPPETVELLRGHWNLIELYGKPVPSTNKQPHMIINQEEKRVTGNGGCNSFFGSIENSIASKIKFSQIGSTKMACSNMEVETKFFQMFERARYYSTSGDTLTLQSDWTSPLARFVLVPGKKE